MILPVGGLSRALEHLALVVWSVLHVELRGDLLYLQSKNGSKTKRTSKRQQQSSSSGGSGGRNGEKKSGRGKRKTETKTR